MSMVVRPVMSSSSTPRRKARKCPGAVTLLAVGRFVVVWTHDTGSYYVRDEIVAQIFNPNGTKSGPEFIVNTEYLLEQTDPKIATLADGRFVVTWRDNYEYPYETGDDTPFP